jgi:hypothetical protein
LVSIAKPSSLILEIYRTVILWQYQNGHFKLQNFNKW